MFLRNSSRHHKRQLFSAAAFALCAIIIGCGGSGASGTGTTGATGTNGSTVKNPYSGNTYKATGFSMGTQSGVLSMTVSSTTTQGTLTVSPSAGKMRKPAASSGPPSGTYSFSGAFNGSTVNFEFQFSGIANSSISGTLPGAPSLTGGTFTLNIQGTTYGPFTFKNYSVLTTFAVNVVGLRSAGGDTQGYDLNDSGEIVGGASDSSGTSHAFIWTAKNGLQDLGAYGGISASLQGVDDGGNYMGSYQPQGSAYGLPIYNGKLIGPPTGCDAVEPYGIVNGQAIFEGYVSANGEEQPVNSYIYSNGKYTDIGTGSSGEIFLFGKSGGIVFGEQASSTSTQGVLWEWQGSTYKLFNWQMYGDVGVTGPLSNMVGIGPNGEALGTLANGDAGYVSANGVTVTDMHHAGTVYALNSSGQAVGNYTDAKGNPHGFYYSATMPFTDLSTLIDQSLGLTILSAIRINQTGQILCQTSNPKVTTDYYMGIAALLTPSS